MVSFDVEEHLEQAKDITTGLIGALLELDLSSISGPEIGSGLPVVVTHLYPDYIRIFVDPKIESYKEEGREFVRLSAFSYLGDKMMFDTIEWTFGPYKRIGEELLRQDNLFRKVSSGHR